MENQEFQGPLESEMNITDTPESLEIEIKRQEYLIKKEELRIKKKEFEELQNSKFYTSTWFISIATVFCSCLFSLLISYYQIKQSKKEFNTQLIESIMDDEVVVTKRKIEFLLASKTLQDNESDIRFALSNLCKNSSSFYLQKGIKLIEENKDYLAVQQLDNAIELDSTNFEAYKKRAECNEEIGKNLKSKEFLIRALADFKKAKILKNTSEINFRIATLYYNNGDNENALKFCELAIQKKPKSSKLYNLKGMVLIKEEKLNEACEAFQISNNFNPLASREEISKYCN